MRHITSVKTPGFNAVPVGERLVDPSESPAPRDTGNDAALHAPWVLLSLYPSSKADPMRFVPDTPIVRQGDDALGAGAFVGLMQRAIVRTETPFVFGLLGGWGTGKTSILSMLQDCF